MAIKGYSAFPKASALLEPHHQIIYCHIQDIRWGFLTSLQRSSRCILQPQPTGQSFRRVLLLLIVVVVVTVYYSLWVVHSSFNFCFYLEAEWQHVSSGHQDFSKYFSSGLESRFFSPISNYSCVFFSKTFGTISNVATRIVCYNHYFTSCEFFTPVLNNYISLKSSWLFLVLYPILTMLWSE